jgi:hypothetical protein
MGNSTMCICLSNQTKENISNINVFDLTKENNEFSKNNKNLLNKVITIKNRKIEEKKEIEENNSKKMKENLEKNNINNTKTIKNGFSKKSTKSEEKNLVSEKKRKKKEEIKEDKNEEKKKEIIEKKINLNKTIIICGPFESGKTSFLIRLCDDKFDDYYIPSIKNEIREKNIFFGQKEFKFKFIVTNNLKDNFHEEINCFFVLYDVNNKQSFKNAKKIFYDYLLNENKNSDINHKVVFFIGNKKDLIDNVNNNEVEDFCLKYNIINMCVSVKDNIGFVALIQKLSEYFQE